MKERAVGGKGRSGEAARQGLALPIALVALVGLVGCDDEDLGGRPDPIERGASLMPYPDGPYDLAVGSTAPNYAFQGLARPLESSEFSSISLGDFFNPDWLEVFDEDSQYGNGQKPKTVAIVVSAVWCGPCQHEARTVLPGKYAAYNERGGGFLLLLADSREPGVPASEDDLLRWTRAFETPFPAVIDPARRIARQFRSDAYPINILVRTDQMQIVDVVTGVPDDSYWVALERLLD